MPTREEALIELYHLGALNPKRKEAVEELGRRGLLDLSSPIQKEETEQPPRQSGPEQLSLRQQAVDETIKDIWPTTAFAISVGKGIENVGRGMGILPDPSEQSQEGMARLEKKFPISTTAGEITGEAAPFMVPGAKIGQLASVPLRVAASGVLGAAEGGILSNAEGQDIEKGAGLGAAFGMGAEVLFPIIGRLGRSVFQRIKGKPPVGAILDISGKPTPEFQEALEQSGLSFEDLRDDAVQLINEGKAGDPAQAARKSFLESQGLKPTKAQVTRDAADFQAQQEAVKTSGRARSAIEEQESILSTRFNNSVRETTGDAYSPTNTVIDSVVNKATVLDREIGSLYKEARELSPGAKNVEFKGLTEKIRKWLPADRRTGGNIEALMGDMKSKGIIDKDLKVIGSVDVETAEDLRKMTNELYDPQNPFGNMVLRDIKDSLDEDVFKAAGEDVYKRARKAKFDFEKELSRAKISKFDSRKQNLVRDILENKIDPDQMTEKVVFGKAWRPADLQQLKDYIGDAGPLNDLKADVLENIKNKSFIGPEDASGFKALSRSKLENTINKIGWKKINIIFDEPEIKFLKDMLKVSKLREPVRGTALGKGPSAQAIAALEKKIGDLPLIGALVNIVDYDAAGRAVLKAKPQRLEIPKGIEERLLPAPVAAAGIATTSDQQEETTGEPNE